MLEAFIFDLDGTLLDSEIVWVETVRRALDEKGYALTHEEATELVYGKAWSDIFEEIRRDYPDAYADRAAMEEVTGRYYRQLQAVRDIRIHSSVALLVELAQEYPVAIASGSTRETIAEGIALMNIEPYVRTYVGVEDYGPGKPDPACFLLAAERLGVPPAGCLVFEDSAAGVLAAKRADMRCVALQRPGRPPQAVGLADEVMPDLAEFNLGKYRTVEE